MSELEAAEASVGCAGCAALREELRRANARAAALAEESEKLHSERDGLQQLLEEARAEVQAVTEEMAAAARFSDSEWREHCDRVEAEGRRLRSVIAAVTATALELLPGAGEAARRRVQEEAAAERKTFVLTAYRSAVAAARAFEASASVGADAPPASADGEQRDESPANESTIEQNALIQISLLCCALDCTREELHDKYLGWEGKKGSDDWYNTSAQARGLWELYLALCDVGFPTDATIAKLLETEEEVCELHFNAFGHDPEYGEFNYAIPPTANAYDFFHRLLRHLPELVRLWLSHLPPLSSQGALEALAGAPPTLEWLCLHHTEHTVADLVGLRQRCPQLHVVDVHPSRCTDWGEYASIEDRVERTRRMRAACGQTVFWDDGWK